MSTSTYQDIHIREPAAVVLDPVPKQYEFLKSGGTAAKYRIHFRHPAYAPDENLLFTLFAWDYPQGGIHHGLAHNACAIFADNRFDGYLSRTCNGEHGDRIDAPWDVALPTGTDYYFYVPYPSYSSSSPSGETRPPYRWPVVLSFQDWKFPRILPETWERCRDFQGISSPITSQSTFETAIYARDGTCRVSAWASGKEAAHLVPRHEGEWFLSNNMADLNNDQSLDVDNLLQDLSNAMLLRSDLHKAFDERQFIFFPKDAKGMVLHMLAYVPDIRLLYHNRRLDIPTCGLEFLFARFAWAIFPFLSAFLARPATSRLIVRVKADTGERVVEEVTNSIMLVKKAAAARSKSPTKRSRTAANLNDEDVHRFSTRQKFDETASASSIDSSLLPSDDGIEAQLKPATKIAQTSGQYQKGGGTPRDGEHIFIEELRQKALAQQRPAR